MNLQIISAGAGSGKTYRLTSEMVRLLKEGVRPEGIIATTFTQRAAAELQERVRGRLLKDGLREQAEALSNALIGTVHSLGVKLLQRFSYEAGVSPEVSIIAEEDQQILFNQSLSTILTEERVKQMDELCARLSLDKDDYFDWRSEVRKITEIARANAFDRKVLEESKAYSFQSFAPFLAKRGDHPPSWYNQQLGNALQEAIHAIEQNEADSTKATKEALRNLKEQLQKLQQKGKLIWADWARIGKLPIGAKSRDLIEDLQAFANRHDEHPDFHDDIKGFMEKIFDLAALAMGEFQEYKKQRGLIDYTDMEVQVNRLLDHPQVKAVLEDELDLLMVDEFQDTSPIQLQLFLKLSRLASHSVWVGDPKQSIYGFRGAAPELMQAIIQETGGIQPENIQRHSWRSREDLVYISNALFSKAFDQLPEEQIALLPKRRKEVGPESSNKLPEPIEAEDPLFFWQFEYQPDDGQRKRQPAKPWFEQCLADSLADWLENPPFINPKDEKDWRPAQPGDIAILCRSNKNCQDMAEALHRAGLKAAIARNGLLQSPEARLILAALRYLLTNEDSLAVAELLLLGQGMPLAEILEDRLLFLQLHEEQLWKVWGPQFSLSSKLDDLRPQTAELSGAEILDLILDELDLRRIIASFGNPDIRLGNVDQLRLMATQYEEACNRMYSAASLGGFLLWLDTKARTEGDPQSAGISPDAVNVLTYHKSKGLEWPVVICHKLETKLRVNLWGTDIVSKSEKVDLNDVLGNRLLRYWVNPYYKQEKNTPIERRLREDPINGKHQKKALEEENRLLYVGITRARDYLILPAAAEPTRWLNRAWHQGEEDTPTLDVNTPESPFEWKGYWPPVQSKLFTYSTDIPERTPQAGKIEFLLPRSGSEDHPNHYIDLRKEDWSDSFSCQVGPEETYAGPLPIELLQAEEYILGKALKAMITALQADYPAPVKGKIVENALKKFELEGVLNPTVILDRLEQWGQWQSSHFSGFQEMRKYPLFFERDQRRFSTMLDLVLKSEDRLIIIQQSGYGGSNTKAKARELGSWCWMVKQGLQQVFPKTQIRTFIHFPLRAGVLEVETTDENIASQD